MASIFPVKRGTIHALIGPNGAGKTTCFNLLTHFLIPTRGQIFFNGRGDHRLAPLDDRAHGDGALVPDLGGISAPDRARERADCASEKARPFLRFLARRGQRSRRSTRARLELIDAVGLNGFSATPAVELAYGRKRALEIATTLALDPEMMLLDEPTAGMTHADVDRIAALIKKVAANRTVLMVEHNLSVVSTLSDHITVLARGEILAQGDYAAVSKNPNVIQAYLGAGHA